MTITKSLNTEFEDVLDLLNSSMEYDKFTTSLLKEKIFDDPDYDTSLNLTAKENDVKAIGFLCGVIRQRDKEKMAYIKLFAVSPHHRRKGIATALYKAFENEIKSRGVKKIRLFESFPNYYMPGLNPFYTEAICFFERNKFKKIGDCSNLSAELQFQNFDTSKEELELVKEGFEIVRAKDTDFENMITWTEKNFRGWIGEVKSAFANDEISIHLAKLNSEIIAFSAYETNNKGIGWFGPMGTTEAARGKGIGGILLKRCLADMKNIGFKTAIIPWVGPIPFYMYFCGSKVNRVFWRYEKTL